MAGQVRVFVSHHHSREEDAITARLVADLATAGAKVWVDVAGVGAADFQDRINEALANCEWFVLVLTPEALASKWVKIEVHAAIRLVTQGRMRGIIQVMAKPVRQDAIPPTWGIYANFDATRDYATARNLTLRELGLKPLPDRAVPPLTHTPAQPGIPPDRFPPRLVSLGYEGRVINGVEVIIPPLCDVPAGAFLMGSDPSRDKETQDDEKPQHWVTLPVFEIGKFPVTVAEYACFVRTGQKEPGHWRPQFATLDHPVTYVSWHDAVAYVMWLAKLTGEPWRLPSEAEWEKAARWDAAMRTSCIYPWGDVFDETKCNAGEGSKKTTTPVGSYPSGASPYGAQEMSGNVWEWASTLYKSYPYRAADGRENLNSWGNRVLRGGSWLFLARSARAASRFNERRGFTGFNDGFGFRVARAVPSS